MGSGEVYRRRSADDVAMRVIAAIREKPLSVSEVASVIGCSDSTSKMHYYGRIFFVLEHGIRIGLVVPSVKSNGKLCFGLKTNGVKQ